jgi:hypothetical protein
MEHHSSTKPIHPQGTTTHTCKTLLYATQITYSCTHLCQAQHCNQIVNIALLAALRQGRGHLQLRSHRERLRNAEHGVEVVTLLNIRLAVVGLS